MGQMVVRLNVESLEEGDHFKCVGLQLAAVG